MAELLRIEHISKKFGNFYANHDISLSVNEGEILTLLGENGAGKSTLMNILSGLYRPTEGTIYVRGRKCKFNSPSEAVSAGIGMVHQHFMLVEAMTVFENIILGDRRSPGFFIDRDQRRAEIEKLCEDYGLTVNLDKKITEISVGEQQRTEILKALYHGADLLILDEPSAVLTDVEVKGLYLIMERLVSEGKSIIFISHKMREVMYVSDRVGILRAGKLVDLVQCDQVTETELARKMIGRELTESHYGKVEKTGDDAVLKLKNVTFNEKNRHNSLRGVSLEVHPGEIVGIAGVDGNGQTQLAQLVCGVVNPQTGAEIIKGKKLMVYDPHELLMDKVAHISEDRKHQGLVTEMSVAENLILRSASEKRFSGRFGLRLKDREIKKYAESMAEKYDIRLNNVSQPASDLSGGNQQKIILAREIESQPDLLVAAHPTRGLDVGAARFIHDRLIDVRDRGAGVLLISADFDEILEMSDRILVLFEGKITGEFSGTNPSVDDISLAMTGKKKEKGETK